MLLLEEKKKENTHTHTHTHTPTTTKTGEGGGGRLKNKCFNGMIALSHGCLLKLVVLPEDQFDPAQ